VSRPPGLEPLEGRHLLSVAPAEIASTVPGDGQAVLQPPQQLVINFDPGEINQLDDLFSGLFGTTPAQTFPAIVALDNNTYGDSDEFEIDRVGAGGVTTPYLGGNSLLPLQVAVTTTTDDDGNTTQSQMVITPVAGDPTLLPGTYQLDIHPGTALDTAFSFIDASTAWTSSQPIPIAQFTVMGQGITFGDATSLGDVGTTTWSVSGFIDPQSSQHQIALYQITLPQGNLWQLNAQVLAQAIGSPLEAGLAIFGSDGNLLAASIPGDGLAPFSNDPYLSKGLEPGTYYLAVSDFDNVPGLSGSYDLQTGTPGTAGFEDSGGAFQLHMIATPVVGSTTLTSDTLQYGDSLEPSPTGLELTFSGPVDLTPLFLPDQQETALEVVGASGQVWPITADSYQAATNTLDFNFDEPLPAGSYSLVVPAQGGLTDLSGLQVVVPAGNPPGVLASWTVAPDSGPSDPDDLGVVWPGPVNVTWDSGITKTIELTAGQDVSYRFVVICPGIYDVQTQVAAGQVDLEVTGADGTTVLDAPDLMGLNNSLMDLGVGVYTMRMTAGGAQPAMLQWTLSPVALDYEKIIENGVLQSAVLTIPTADSQSGTTNFASLDGMPSAATYSGSGAGSSLTTLSASPIPAGLLVSMNAGLMGLPTTNAQDVGAVGPMAEGALAAVADRVHGLLPGITYSPRSDSESRVGNGGTPEVVDPSDGLTPADPRATASIDAGPADPEAAVARNDGRALARADQLVRIAAWIEDFLGFPSENGPESRSEVEARPIAVAVEDRGEARGLARGSGRPGPYSPRGNTRESMVLGDLRAPLGLILAASVAYRLRRPIETWWRRKATASAADTVRPHRHRPIIRGPHSRPVHMGTTFQPRGPRSPLLSGSEANDSG
jgi:hypothetical protein